MHDIAVRRKALSALADGEPMATVCARTGISRSTVRGWVVQAEPRRQSVTCPRHEGACPPQHAYVYLLGMYLGDGHISQASRTQTLRVTCDDHWPGVMAECATAIAGVSGRKVYRIARAGCTDLATHWNHWGCLFPQHGPGMKHTRPIELEPWQRELVAADPRPLVRGLIQSDGCRAMNTVHRSLPAGTRTYAYPRYFFSNMSADIRGIFTDALDQLDIAWRQNRFNSISVARRDAVAAMDVFVGPKT